MDRSQTLHSTHHNPRHILEEINSELATVTQRSDELKKKITALYFWNDPVGNRRVRQRERREHVERRRIVRPDGDRRVFNSDRRMPLEGRHQLLQTELARLAERERELAEVSQKLHRQS